MSSIPDYLKNPSYTPMSNWQNTIQNNINKFKQDYGIDLNGNVVNNMNNVNVNNNINNLTNGLVKPNIVDSSLFKSFEVNGNKFINLGSYDSVINNENLLKQFNITDPSKQLININGHAMLVQQPNFLEKYGSTISQGINAVTGLGNLIMGIKNYNTSKNLINTQTKVLQEQLKETKHEYNRIHSLRKKLSAQYGS